MLKIRKTDFALIATHAKLRIVDSGVSKGFSFIIKGMARRAFNIHPSKAVNVMDGLSVSCLESTLLESP